MRRWLAVFLVVSAVLFGACGGGKDEPDDEGVKASTSSDDDADDESSDEDSDDRDDRATAAGLFTSSDGLDAVPAMSAAVSAAGLAMAGQTDEIEKTAKQMDEFADKAPDAVKDDIQILRDAYGDYGEIIRKSGWKPDGRTPPPQSVIDQLEEAGKKLESDEVKGAQERLDAFFAEECPGG
jgi:hypothetical protein